MAVLHQPTKQKLDLKRVSRLVVLPDYQGTGIGRVFLDTIAEMYVSQGHMFEIKTSARNLIGSLVNHPGSRMPAIEVRWCLPFVRTPANKWVMKDFGFAEGVWWRTRKECKTANFVFVAEDG